MSGPEADTRRVAFLDGVRGWAAVSVLLAHLLPCFLARTAPVYNQPWLALLTDGQFAVVLFFILSGFALSTGAVTAGGREVLAALALRRYPRLIVPIAASCLLGYLLLRVGAMHNMAAAGPAKSENWLGTFYGFAPDFPAMLRLAFYDVFFAYDQARSYQPSLWTMATELLGSAIVLGFCAVFLPLQRRWIPLGIGAALLLAQFPNLAPFLLGVALAVFHHHPFRARAEGRRMTLIFALSACALVALYVMVRMQALPGPDWLLEAFTPTVRRDALAVTLLVLAIGTSRPLRRLFDGRLSRYLGRLSFPLYLTHIPVICSFSSFVFLRLTERGITGDLRAHLVLATSLPVCWLVAHLFLPVERAGIDWARRFSDGITNRASRRFFPLQGTAPANDLAGQRGNFVGSGRQPVGLDDTAPVQHGLHESNA